MRITTRGRYALRATLALAKLTKEGGPVSINQLSEKENISPVFLEQIFFNLRKSGLVDSMRGPGGGFNFAKPLNQLTVKNILEAAGEDLNITFCDRHIDQCERSGECLSHNVWVDLTTIINNYFGRLTLESILDKHRVKNEPGQNTGDEVILEI